MTLRRAARWSALALTFTLGISAAEARPWRHGVLEAKSDAGFLYMIEHGGFAKKDGLDLQLVPVKNESLALRALIAGDLDSYEGTPPFAAVARGSDAKIIGCHWTGLPHALFVRDGIKKVADLKGHSIASSAPGSLPDLIARAVLDLEKVPAKDVTFANVGGDSDRYRAVTHGMVDATVISSEYEPVAAAENVHIMVQARDAMPDFMRLCYISTSKVLGERMDDAVTFLKAEHEALSYALAHRDETIAFAHQAASQKEDDPRAAYVFDDAVKTHSVDPDLPIPVKKIESMQDTLLQAGVTPSKVDVSTMIDTRAREKALGAAAK